MIKKRGTGEVSFTHPAWRKAIIANGRNKDAKREIVVALRRLVNGRSDG